MSSAPIEFLLQARRLAIPIVQRNLLLWVLGRQVSTSISRFHQLLAPSLWPTLHDVCGLDDIDILHAILMLLLMLLLLVLCYAWPLFPYPSLASLLLIIDETSLLYCVLSGLQYSGSRFDPLNTSISMLWLFFAHSV
jgi:hypothetical protein